MSIAVLRTFISKRKQEHEAYLLKRTKAATKASEKDSSEPAGEAADESLMNDEEANGECEVSEEVHQDEPCSISKESVKTHEGKGCGELKPARVLEVFL